MAPKRGWFRRIRWRWVIAAMPVLLLLGLVGGYLWAKSVFDKIERVDTAGTLDGGGLGSGTNYLLVGSDTREGVEGGEAGITDGDFPGGQRSDTMVVLHTGSDGTRILSIPRDLYVEIADTGESGKINGAFNGGAPRLIRTISESLDIPIHRYVEVDFVSFAGLVDALGGITIDFPNPAFDTNTGLMITEAGPQELDGEQALQYVRSRHYHEVVNGVDQGEDPTADLGRIQRQQAFLRAVFDKLGDTKNPITLGRTLSSTADGLRIDDEMGLFDALRLAWTLRSGLDPEPLQLPTTSDSNESGSVLILNEEEAQPILDQLR
jgi:LCP family protein required for cell wall assembly